MEYLIRDYFNDEKMEGSMGQTRLDFVKEEKNDKSLGKKSPKHHNVGGA